MLEPLLEHGYYRDEQEKALLPRLLGVVKRIEAARENVGMAELLGKMATPGRLAPGDVAEGRVVLVNASGVLVDVGTRQEGLIAASELAEESKLASLRPGDRVRVMIVADSEEEGLVLSWRRAAKEGAWLDLEAAQRTSKALTGTVSSLTKGGVVVDLGIRAFMPASHCDLRRIEDLSSLIGQEVQVKVLELDRRQNRVVVSRRAFLAEDSEKRRAQTLAALKPGEVVQGTVTRVTDFGAFIDLGGIDGLAHVSELSRGQVEHPSQVVAVGQLVRAEVLAVDSERGRVSLSLKRLTADPWAELGDYAVGQKVRGIVTKLLPFGAFVELKPGLEGLIHVSELSWSKRVKHPEELLKKGEVVEAVILKVEPEQRRLSLSLRQGGGDPWETLEQRHPVGSILEGQVTRVTDFGAFVQVEEGIEGLVHVSELDLEQVDDPRRVAKAGLPLKAKVLAIDLTNRRIQLSRKAALADDEPQIAAELPQPERPATLGDVYGHLFKTLKLPEEK
ncbi:MAG: 30S ribosomal protein S1 [Deinococcus sp.]|nr:30S ribosomal protein S1 [Deinococcus sp.]